jgi:hypothetical protein
MTKTLDWQAVAKALDAPVDEHDVAVIAALETLERNFRPLQEKVPLDAPLWHDHP